jgi:hypothetical protein
MWAWLEEHLEFFDPRDRATAHQLAHLKAFDELCLLGVLKHQYNSELYLTNRIVDRCLAIVRPVPVPFVFVEHINHFQLIAAPSALQSMKGQQQTLKSLLRLSVPTMGLFAAERLPHRLLDVGYCVRLCGIEDIALAHSHELALIEDAALRSSNLFLGVAPHLSSVSDFYALTHTILFATEFGLTRGSQLFQSVPRDVLVSKLELAVLRFLCEQNFDIVAELLWCLQILSEYHSPIVALAVASIAGNIRTYGYLQGPDVGSAIPVAPSNDLIYRNYHSTLLACALLSNHAIEEAADADLETYDDAVRACPISAFYDVGTHLHQISIAHPLARYEYFHGLRATLDEHPYLHHERFARALGSTIAELQSQPHGPSTMSLNIEAVV